MSSSCVTERRWPRHEFLLAAMQPTLQRVHTSVAGSDVAFAVRIANPHVPEGVGDVQSIRKAFSAALEDTHAQEVASGRNLVGPQRDDLEVFVRNRPLRDFGSRGEWRTAVVALKLAELEHLANARGERPILLLDDVLSELDADRRRTLEPWFALQQTVLATTDRHELSDELLRTATVRTVVRGSVSDADVLVDAKSL
jgi:DNA replication and repair protein RecF